MSADILIADDCNRTVRALTYNLQTTYPGTSVISASTVTEAIRLLDATPSLQLAVVDLGMDKSGTLILEHIKEHGNTFESLVVFVLSGNTPELNRIREDGGNSYTFHRLFYKPVRADEIHSAIRESLPLKFHNSLKG